VTTGKPLAFVVVGTRPEAIKLAPVVEALRRDGRVEAVLVATSQHREMLRQALRPFGLVPDVDLDVMTVGQTPTRVAMEVLRRFEPLILERKPAWIVAQGDTTTTFAAAVAGFYAGVPVAHVEAGLRTGRLDSPFPEEFNRRAAAVATTLHLAPTTLSRQNLLAEGVRPESILVVGNTAVDAVLRIRGGRCAEPPAVGAPPLVLVTLHRRESFGEPIHRVLQALRELALEREGRVHIVYPVHPNPNVDGPARQALTGLPNVELHSPMDYPEFLDLFARARFVLSDSGGVQEEGPTLGVPVLILRETTERPEVVHSGWGKLLGTDHDLILSEARRLLDDDDALAAMKRGANPFGDGHSAEAIARALAERLT
jgi:UDP-N-acetylglucosamine 2-epimerase (non-hydrolysing)